MLVVFLKIRNVGSGGYRKEDGRRPGKCNLLHLFARPPPPPPGSVKSGSGSLVSGTPDTYSHWEGKEITLVLLWGYLHVYRVPPSFKRSSSSPHLLSPQAAPAQVSPAHTGLTSCQRKPHKWAGSLPLAESPPPGFNGDTRGPGSPALAPLLPSLSKDELESDSSDWHEGGS